MWTLITGGLTSIFTSWMENRTKLKTAKLEKEIKELDATSDYDITAQQNMKHSWKDEYLIILHTFPIWGYLLPSEELTIRLDTLWTKLEGAPDWWWGIYIGMVISTFGLRFMADKLKK